MLKVPYFEKTNLQQGVFDVIQKASQEKRCVRVITASNGNYDLTGHVTIGDGFLSFGGPYAGDEREVVIPFHALVAIEALPASWSN